MSEQKNSFCTEQELRDMFDTKFLPILQEISYRLEKTMDKDVRFFRVEMSLNFPHEKTLTYDSIKDLLNLRIKAITQEELDS